MSELICINAAFVAGLAIAALMYNISSRISSRKERDSAGQYRR